MSVFGRHRGGREAHRSGTVFVNAVQVITGKKTFVQGALAFFGLTEANPTTLSAQDTVAAAVAIKLPATSGTLALAGAVVAAGAITQQIVNGAALHTTNAQVNHAYISNNSFLETFLLPAVKSDGDEVWVQGIGNGGWKITQNAGEFIRFGSQITTVGVTGYLYSNNQYNFVKLKWSSDLSLWYVHSVIGNPGGH